MQEWRPFWYKDLERVVDMPLEVTRGCQIVVLGVNSVVIQGL